MSILADRGLVRPLRPVRQSAPTRREVARRAALVRGQAVREVAPPREEADCEAAPTRGETGREAVPVRAEAGRRAAPLRGEADRRVAPLRRKAEAALARRRPAALSLAEPGPAVPARVARERRGESLRPPTRARVVAGRTGTPAACAEARRPAVRWPWLLAIAAAACLVVTALGVFGAGAPGGAVPSGTASISVEPGDTLSAIAARFAPNSDQAAVVTRIEQLNNLDGAVLTPGLPLTVPVAAGTGLGS